MSKINKLKSVAIASVLMWFALTGTAEEMQTPMPVSGSVPGNVKQITPSDVLARVKLVKAELDLIRIAMGKHKESSKIITVKNAAPREVYFQAQAMFEKADTLAYEFTGNTVPEPKIKKKKITPSDVWSLVNESLKRVLVVKHSLNITEKVNEMKEPDNKTPTDVYNNIIEVNQDLNNLLDQKFSPSKVYEQVTLAISYTEKLLRQFKKGELIPSEPAYQANMTPSDVYQRLLECVRLLKEIALDSGVAMLDVKVNKNALQQVVPSNVYDLAKVIVAEVRYFYSVATKNIKFIDTYYPGKKIPSDVYQRSGILLKQIELLKTNVKQNPSWLRKQKGLTLER